MPEGYIRLDGDGPIEQAERAQAAVEQATGRRLSLREALYRTGGQVLLGWSSAPPRRPEPEPWRRRRR